MNYQNNGRDEEMKGEHKFMHFYKCTDLNLCMKKEHKLEVRKREQKSD